jgi:hypothetical protein
VTSFSAFVVGKGFFRTVFGNEIICIKFSLLDEALNSLRSGGVFWGFELLELKKDFFFDGAGYMRFLGFLLTHGNFINEGDSWRDLSELVRDIYEFGQLCIGNSTEIPKIFENKEGGVSIKTRLLKNDLNIYEGQSRHTITNIFL